jgi:hypothetical protein
MWYFIFGNTEYEAWLKNLKVPVWVLYVELATCTSQFGNVNFLDLAKWTWETGEVNLAKYPGSVFHTSILDLTFGVEDHAEDPQLVKFYQYRMLISTAPSKFA